MFLVLQSKIRGVEVVSAYCRESKAVVRFHVGSRTHKTLNRVLISLQLSEAKRIYTFSF